MLRWDRQLRREVRRAGRVAVVGIGNPARGDDAAGGLVARDLLAGPDALPASALVIDAGEAPENHTGLVRAFAPALTVLVDCALGGHPPGTIFVVDPAAIADEDISTHRVPLSRLARYIRETMDSQVFIIGIEPSSVDGGGGVSPEVGRAARQAAAAIRRILRAL